jgi:hypothetical protein
LPVFEVDMYLHDFAWATFDHNVAGLSQGRTLLRVCFGDRVVSVFKIGGQIIHFGISGNEKRKRSSYINFQFIN